MAQSQNVEQMEGPVAERPAEPLLCLTHGTRRDLSAPLVTDEELGHAELTKMELTRRVVSLAKQADRLANYVQGLPTQEDWDAMLVNVTNLEAQNAALRERIARADNLLAKFVGVAA